MRDDAYHIQIIQVTHVWHGVILSAGFMPLVHLSRWWLIPVFIGVSRILQGAWKSHRIVMKSFRTAESKQRGGAKPGELNG